MLACVMLSCVYLCSKYVISTDEGMIWNVGLACMTKVCHLSGFSVSQTAQVIY